jgi:hypothetical protein
MNIPKTMGRNKQMNWYELNSIVRILYKTMGR